MHRNDCLEGMIYFDKNNYDNEYYQLIEKTKYVCDFVMNTYASWTSDIRTAENFSRRYLYPYGVILKVIVGKEDILVACDYIKNKFFKRNEFILKPNIYKNTKIFINDV